MTLLLLLFSNSDYILKVLTFSPLLPSSKWIFEILAEGLLKDTCVDNHSSDKIGVNITSRSPVLNIALTISMCSRSWDSKRSCSVSNSIWKIINRWCLVDTCQSLLVIITVECNMLAMLFAEFFHHLVDIFHTTCALAHCFCREVCVTARTIPVLEELRCKRYCYVKIFSDSL